MSKAETTIKISDLKPDNRNARKHSERNLSAIENSLREVGAGRSIVIDETGTVLAGNATIKAAQARPRLKIDPVQVDGK